MADNLTPRQQEILQLIRDTVELEGRPPTRAEICTAFGFRSPNAAETHLRALAAKGAITLEEGRARGIRLMEALGLPLIGRVAAGSPILAAEHVQGRGAGAGRSGRPLGGGLHEGHQVRPGPLAVALDHVGAADDAVAVEVDIDLAEAGGAGRERGDRRQHLVGRAVRSRDVKGQGQEDRRAGRQGAGEGVRSGSTSRTS